jgi:transposase
METDYEGRAMELLVEREAESRREQEEQKRDRSIWELRLLRLTYRQIANPLGVGRDRVAKVVKAWSIGKTVSHPRKGPPMKATELIMDCIEQALRENDLRTAKILRNKVIRRMGVTLSESTLRTILQKKNYKWRPRRSCPHLTEAQVRARQQFIEDWNSPLFANVRGLPMVFTDESRFCERPDNQWTWVRRGEMMMSIMAELEKFTHLSVMVWGAIGYNYKSRLFIITGTVNAEKYQNMLAEFFTNCDAAFGRGGWVLVQDGAPAHTAQKTINYVCSKCRLMPSWPPNSPDLNPIEALWGAVKRNIDWTNLKTLEQAIAAVTAAWNEIPQDKVNDLVGSFANRVQMVDDADGLTIQPALSSHKTTIPEGYLADATRFERELWTKEENEFLEAHRDWKVKDLVLAFTARQYHHDAADIRKRLRLIEIHERNKEWGQPILMDFGGMTDEQIEEMFSAEMDAFAKDMIEHANAMAIPETETDDSNDIPQTDIQLALTESAIHLHDFAKAIADYSAGMSRFAGVLSEGGAQLLAAAPHLAEIEKPMAECGAQMCCASQALYNCVTKMELYTNAMQAFANDLKSMKEDLGKFAERLGLFSSFMGHVAADMGSFSPEMHVLSKRLGNFAGDMADFAVNIAVAYPELQDFAAEMGAMAAKTGGRADHLSSFAKNASEFASGLWSFAADLATLPSTF